MAFSIGEICLGGTVEDVRHLLAMSFIGPLLENSILVSVASSRGREDVLRVLLEDGRMDPMFRPVNIYNGHRMCPYFRPMNIIRGQHKKID